MELRKTTNADANKKETQGSGHASAPSSRLYTRRSSEIIAKSTIKKTGGMLLHDWQRERLSSKKGELGPTFMLMGPRGCVKMPSALKARHPALPGGDVRPRAICSGDARDNFETWTEHTIVVTTL